jgi:hypothetical protein
MYLSLKIDLYFMKKIKTRIDFFKERPGMVIAELGVYEGDFSRELWECEPLNLFMVDIWTGATSSADRDGKNNTQNFDMLQTYIYLLIEFDYPNTQVVRCKSVEFLSKIEDDYLDCVYIDSDHSYETTIQELRLSIPKVKKGGWITGHDYVYLALGVIQAVDEFIKETGYTIEYMSEDGCPSYYIINDK